MPVKLKLKLLQMCWWGKSFKKHRELFIKGLYCLALQYTEVLHDKSSPYYPIMETTFFLLRCLPPLWCMVALRVGAFAYHRWCVL